MLNQEQLTELLIGARQNDRSAQELLYRYYHSHLYQYLRRFSSDEQELVSILNDTFLKAFVHIGRYSPERGSFIGWLKRIATNKAIDHLRQNRKEKELQAKLLGAAQEKVCTAPESCDYLQQLIHGLPQQPKRVLQLSMEGYSHREIANRLQITEISSRWHLSEARRRLKRLLQFRP